MKALVRLTLVAALALLAGGTVVGTHQDPPGKPHLHADHVPAALRLAIFTRFGHLFKVDGPAFVQVQAPTAVAAITALAPPAARFPRLWRPGRLGVVRPGSTVVSAQVSRVAEHGPPRSASFAST